MTTFSLYSFRLLQICQYINFTNSLTGFCRPPPGGARGQMPPCPPSLRHWVIINKNIDNNRKSYELFRLPT